MAKMLHLFATLFPHTKNLTSDWEETAAVTMMHAYSLPDIVKADELQIFAAHRRFAFTPGAGRVLLLLTETLYGSQCCLS
jgi:hypothetical protein